MATKRKRKAGEAQRIAPDGLSFLPIDATPEELFAPLPGNPTPEELAKAMFELPADYDWSYLEEEWQRQVKPFSREKEAKHDY